MSGLQKSGYLEVKQPANIKGRKLKTWKKKWAVLHKMSNIAEGTFAAKLDLYPDETSAVSSSQDKVTYIFENVTSIQPANSKTHKFAFEIVEAYPVICLSCPNDQATVGWAKTFQHLFWPPPGPDGEDLFQVIIEENEDSKKYSLSGEYWMFLSPQELKVKAMSKSHTLSWKLSNLKRFNLDRSNAKVLVIESGAKSDFGEAKFMFRSNNVLEIFQCIRKNITLAVEKRQRKLSQGSIDGRGRTSSASNSEKGFKMLLESSKENLNSSIESIEKNDIIRKRAKSQENVTGDPKSSQEKIPPAVPPKERTKSLENLSAKISPQRQNTSKEAYIKSKLRHLSNSYDELTLPSASKLESRRKPPQIISTEIIHDKENKRFIEVGHDKYGYSHIPSQQSMESRTNLVRSVSGYDDCDLAPSPEQNRVKVTLSDHSTDLRSGSLISNDSGFVPSHNAEQLESTSKNIDLQNKLHHRNNNSFDSAISTSSGHETISASVNDVLLVTENGISVTNKRYNTDSDLKECNDQNEIYTDINSHQKQTTPTYEETETQYEDLEKYRKDLSKFLGMDPKVKPQDVPPSLPDRPTSLPARRKDLRKRSKGKTKSNIKVLSRFIKDRNGHHDRSASVTSTSSSSSQSDCEEDTSVQKIQTFQMLNLERIQNNTLYEQTNVGSPASSPEVKCREKHSKESPQRRHSSDPVLVDSGNRTKIDNKNPNSEIENKQTKSVTFDLLTGELMDTLIDENNSHIGILTPTSPSSHFPPVVEKLIPVDIPENKDTEIIVENSKMNGKRLVFKSESDGNFVWDPFPKLADYDCPLIDLDSHQNTDNTSLPQQMPSPITLDTSCYEIMRSASEPITTSTPDKTYMNNMNPLDIFQMNQMSNNELPRNRTPSFEDMLMTGSSGGPEQNAATEPTYMDMSGASNKEECEYVVPSNV